MLTILFVVCSIPSLFFSKAYSLETDYYWREYNGTIPEDAIPGGESFGHKIYIGQAYIRNEGVFPVQINPGVKEVAVCIKGVKRVDQYIKILCGSTSNAEWIPANSTNLHYALLDYRPVIGGHEDNKGYLFIGRLNLDGDAHNLIGKVNAFELGNAKIHYPDKNTEKVEKVYEVLCFVNLGGELDVRSSMITLPVPEKQS